MKRLLLISALLMGVSVTFAQDIAVYFDIIPEEQLLQIDANRRKDMIDMKKAGQPASFANRLGGTSEMTDLTENYLKIRISDNSSFEMKLLPLQDGENVLAVVKTTCAPACDSEISFFTPTWERLPLKRFLQLPNRMDFAAEGVDLSDGVIRETFGAVDMDLIKLSLSPVTNELSATYEVAAYLPDEYYKSLVPFLRTQPLHYLWQDGKYVLSK